MEGAYVEKKRSFRRYEEDLRQNGVCDKDRDRGRDDGLRCRPPNSLGSAPSPHTKMATHKTDERPENRRLRETMKEIRQRDGAKGGVREVGGGDAEGDVGDARSGHHTDRESEDGDQRHHRHRRDDARDDEAANRIGPKRADRVDLLRDGHGAELGGHSSRDAAADDERGECRGEFACLSNTNGARERQLGSIALSECAELEGHDNRDEDSCRERDVHALDTHRVELLDVSFAIEALRERRPQGAKGKEGCAADVLDEPACALDLTGEKAAARFMFPESHRGTSVVKLSATRSK